MASYFLTVDAYKDASRLPATYLDELVVARANWVTTQLELASAWIDAQLTKRYAVPFETPCPLIVQRWLAALVDMECWHKRGFDPDTRDVDHIVTSYNDARAEIKEAADAEKGLFELPLRANTTEGGISKGEPMGYSEQSPYVAFDIQRDVAGCEDARRSGT